MQRSIQIRHVPEDIHRSLRVRAAQGGMTLSEYLLRELTVVARRPTIEDVFERIRARPPEKPRTSSARAVRAERARATTGVREILAGFPDDFFAHGRGDEAPQKRRG